MGLTNDQGKTQLILHIFHLQPFIWHNKLFISIEKAAKCRKARIQTIIHQHFNAQGNWMCVCEIIIN